MALVLKGQNDCVSCLLAVVGLGKKQGTNQCLQKGFYMVCEQVLGVKLQSRVGGATCSTRWLLPREHVARGIWKKCHGHTAGRPELNRERKVQGGETEFPKNWTPVPLLTA